MRRLFIFNGLHAVVVFFIVSGYSLSIGYLQKGDPMKLKRLALGRYFRLSIPIALSCALVYLCACVGLIPQAYISPISKNIGELLRFAFYDDITNYSDLSPIPAMDNAV